jgi:hypothetical protein
LGAPVVKDPQFTPMNLEVKSTGASFFLTTRRGRMRIDITVGPKSPAFLRQGKIEKLQSTIEMVREAFGL